MTEPNVHSNASSPADLVLRFGEATSEDLSRVPVPARQQLGIHEPYEHGSERPELHELLERTPESMLHSRAISGATPASSLNLTEQVTYHLEATPPPAEPRGSAPGNVGYNVLNRGVAPAGEVADHPADYVLETHGNAQTFRLPENQSGDTSLADPFTLGDPANVSDDTRIKVENQTPSVIAPVTGPAGQANPVNSSEVTPLAASNSADQRVDQSPVNDDLVKTTETSADGQGDPESFSTPDDVHAASDPVDENGVPSGSVSTILAWVGSDKARAQAALDAENKAPAPRSTLVNKLSEIAA